MENFTFSWNREASKAPTPPPPQLDTDVGSHVHYNSAYWHLTRAVWERFRGGQGHLFPEASFLLFRVAFADEGAPRLPSLCTCEHLP